jgi:phage anti-repressor protein
VEIEGGVNGMMSGMDELKVVESGIIPVYEDGESRPLVNAREMHKFLESETRFNDWIARRIRQYSFIEGEDFYSILSKTPDGGRPAQEYLLTIDMAKELAMVENNEKGRQVRRYFIECERRLKAGSWGMSARETERLRQRAKRLEIMDRNARSRQAQILKFVIKFFRDILSDVSMQTIASEITALVTGKRLVELPEDEELCSAYEIGEMYDISASLVERIADDNGLKTEEYGKFVLIENPCGVRHFPTFHYNLRAAHKIREILDGAPKERAEETVKAGKPLFCKYLELQ